MIKITQVAVAVLCSWEGNRRSGITPAMSINQSIYVKFVGRRYPTCPGAPTVDSGKHGKKSTLVSHFLNVLVSVMSWRSEGRVFRVVPHSPKHKLLSQMLPATGCRSPCVMDSGSKAQEREMGTRLHFFKECITFYPALPAERVLI